MAMDWQMQRVESKVQKSLERVRLLLKAEKNPQLAQDAAQKTLKNCVFTGKTLQTWLKFKRFLGPFC